MFGFIVERSRNGGARQDERMSVVAWRRLDPTRDTLHMWTQIVGKVRLAHMPLINHWWQVTQPRR
jgi:Family of unknown function (DUF5996)